MGAALLAAPAASFGAVFISVSFAPPALPVYTQPVCPGDGYIWTPGYWAYGPEGYYWVPGVWVEPPTVGYLWTPGYWGWGGSAYVFHPGYWGPHVGFYGGINYGFGYTGVGFAGGYWNGGHFFYNRAVANVNTTSIRNVYVRNVTVVNNNYNRVSFNGGNGGVPARATPQEMQAEREQHVAATQNQEQFRAHAAQNRMQLAKYNNGRPATAAAGTVRDGFGRGNEVNTRQGDQQARINQGVRSGQLTPGETRNLENRDTSIANQARTDRQANGGVLTPQQRQQINQRQNNVSQSIANDRHNANTDAAAAARQDRFAGGEQRQAQRVENRTEPHPQQARPQPEPRQAPAARPVAAPREERGGRPQR